MTDDAQQNAPQDDNRPPVIEGLEILETLGCGGTSSVWKARQISLQRFVVVKVLAEHFVRSDDDIRQFRMEAQIAANLKHNSIVQVYDFGQVREDGRYYFVMEYISGYSVGQWILRKGALPERDALVVVHSVAAALAYAWGKSGIVHCDIKPDNIMIDGDGTIKITDLGLAQVVHSIGHGAPEDDGFVMGTPNYMSPEQMRGDRELDCRSDIYALGMSFYHMVTGRLPYAAPNPADVMRKQMDEVLEHPQRINKDLSATTASLLIRMTAKNLADRIQSWEEVLEGVMAAENQSLPNAPTSASPVVAPPPPESGAVADDAMGQCPHCTTPVRQTARFCPRCGKPSKTTGAAKVRLRVKPLAELRPPPPPPSSPPAQSSVARPPSTRRRKSLFSSMMANLRLLLSLCLLGFIVFYFYKKHQGEDIIIPLRRNIQRTVMVQWHQLRARFLPAAREAASPASSALPSIYDRTTSSATDRSPAPAVPAFRDPPPVIEDAPPPEPAKVKPEEHPDYARLLELCRGEVPQPGDQLVVPLRHHEQDRSGILREITKDGITLEVEAGMINLPFNVMAPEYRLRFFPEQRARRMLRQ